MVDKLLINLSFTLNMETLWHINSNVSQQFHAATSGSQHPLNLSPSLLLYVCVKSASVLCRGETPSFPRCRAAAGQAGKEAEGKECWTAGRWHTHICRGTHTHTVIEGPLVPMLQMLTSRWAHTGSSQLWQLPVC